MRNRKPGTALRHAGSMVAKNRRSYLLLSVTIVLSLALFLGYLLYTDSSLYNRYKETFAMERKLVTVHSSDHTSIAAMNDAINKLDGTACMVSFQAASRCYTHVWDENGAGYASALSIRVHCIPDNAWGLYVSGRPVSVRWLDGQDREGLTPGAGEMAISEGLYYALGLHEQQEPVYRLKIVGKGDAATTYLTLRVVGLIEDRVKLQPGDMEGLYSHEDNPSYEPMVIVSTGTLNPVVAENADWSYRLTCYTDYPEQVDKLIENTGSSVTSIYEYQNTALEEIRSQKSIKAVIAGALILLLGINLYSSFSNALNDRKFEIGVKRAIGASGWSIVRQFLYESLLVMLANILVSIVLVADVFVVYKYIYDRTPHEYPQPVQWTVYISSYSVAMFAVCSIALAVVFSLIFAYKSTRVEIVQYLKAE